MGTWGFDRQIEPKSCETGRIARVPCWKKILASLHKAVYGWSDDFYGTQAQIDSSTLGIMTSGATISNISGLWIARNLALGPSADFVGIEKEGVAAALAHYRFQKAVIICSSFAHYSFHKTAGILRLGERGVIVAWI
jgi:glutamate decarboxylase